MDVSFKFVCSLQKILAQVVHHEIKEEEEYKDMEFTLENGNDKIARRIKELEFRLGTFLSVGRQTLTVSRRVLS